MALVTTTGSVQRLYTPFTGLSATERAASGIARAEIVYYNVNDSWPTPGVGNNRLYQTGQIDLPKDFGYVLTDARIMLKDPGSQVVRAEAAAHYQLFPGGILGPQINGLLDSYPSRQQGGGTTPIGDLPADGYNTTYPSASGNDGVIIYELHNKPTAVLYPFNSSSYTSAANPASVFNFTVSEQVSAQPEYEVSLYIRFLQYDIDQSYNYVLQSPQLTR